MEALTDAILERSHVEGNIAEFGCFKGGSTAKLSLTAARVGKRLLVFDSFQGLPEPEVWDAEHQIERTRVFKRGEYSGTLEEVRANVARWGLIDVCEFHRGWFRDTLPTLREPLSVVFADVDLAASLSEVLDHTWPRLSSRGVFFAHDATDEKLQRVLARYEDLAEVSFVPTRGDLQHLKTKTLAWLIKA